MSETEGHSELPQSKADLEDVPAPEYEESRAFLSAFVDKDTEGITDINTLQGHIEGVGNALRTVIKAKGMFESKKNEIGVTRNRRVLDKDFVGQDEIYKIRGHIGMIV